MRVIKSKIKKLFSIIFRNQEDQKSGGEWNGIQMHQELNLPIAVMKSGT